jgi:hypothetical protein
MIGFAAEKATPFLGTIKMRPKPRILMGYSAEEQITGAAEHGGLQIAVCPMMRQAFERRFPIRPVMHTAALLKRRLEPVECRIGGVRGSVEMGLAAGGRMKQEIFEDPFDLEDWDTPHSSRCFVHIVNSLAWRAITGFPPPTIPPTAKQYSNAGLPWFDYYDDQAKSLPGSDELGKLKSVFSLGQSKCEQPLPENETCNPQPTIVIQSKTNQQVREGAF